MYTIDPPGREFAHKGQAVWRTRSEAEQHLEIAASGFVLYRVFASWGAHTKEPKPRKDATWHTLTISAYMTEVRELEFHDADSSAETLDRG